MTTINLTLTIDEEHLQRANELARARNMTVGQMVERLLWVLSQRPPDPLPPVTRSAVGILPPTSDAEGQTILDEQRMRKHGNG